MLRYRKPNRLGRRLPDLPPDALAGLLQQFLAQGQRAPQVLLILADIYQSRLQDPARAAGFLREYLQTEDDPEAHTRLAELEARTPLQAVPKLRALS